MSRDYIEYPRLKIIEDTDIAYIVAPSGVKKKNGFDKYIDYLSTKTEDVIRPNASNNDRTLREYCYKMYRLGDMTLDELKEEIKKNNAPLIGDTFFSVANQDFSVDDNGNLILRSYGSDLDRIEIKGGDVLIDRSGYVLRKTDGHMFIHKCDSFGNYYCDVFVAKTEYMKDTVDIIRQDFNFLTPDGHRIRQQNFQRSKEKAIHEVKRTYSDNEGDKPFIDSSKTIYPKSYVVDLGITHYEKPMYFPSPAALLIENRARINDGLEPLVDDEKPYIIEHYKREKEIIEAKGKLTNRSSNGKISFVQYKRAMNAFTNEEMINRVFGEFETAEDRKIQNDLEFGEFDNDEPVSE